MASTLWPSARAAKVSAIRCLRIGSAISTTSSIDEGASTCHQHQCLAGARARSPGDQLADLAGFGAGTGRTHKREDRLDHRFSDRQPAHQALRGQQLIGGHGQFRLVLLRAGRVEHDFAFGVMIGIVHVDLHQEAVELGFRQRIGALLLDRVLGREHVKRARNVMAIARDRHMVFLHRLQQR